MPLSWPARGWGKAPQRHLQAPAPATAGGEPSRPHARLLLYPLVNHQFRQPPASQIGDRCSGCPSLLPTRGVPLPGFLLLRGSIKLKPLHKTQGKTNAQSSRLGLTKKKTTHQQEQRRDPHFSPHAGTQPAPAKRRGGRSESPQAIQPEHHPVGAAPQVTPQRPLLPPNCFSEPAHPPRGRCPHPPNSSPRNSACWLRFHVHGSSVAAPTVCFGVTANPRHPALLGGFFPPSKEKFQLFNATLNKKHH